MEVSRFMKLSVVLVAVLALFAVTAQAARVIGPWTTIYEGVEYATGSDTIGWSNTTPSTLTVPRLMKAHVLRVDLWNPKVVLYASHGNGDLPGEATIETGLQFVADHGCNVAVNASWGDPPGSGDNVDIWGLTISDGVVVSPGDTIHGPQYNAQLKFTADNFPSILTTTATPTGVWTAVSGNAYHLVSGMCLGATETVDPRTSAGFSQDKRYLILMCVDGRQPGYSDGATILDMSYWMKDFGAWDAVNLDGGGSTCMTRADIGIVNSPTGGSYIRPVSVHLGVKTGAGVDNPPYTFDNDIDGWFPGGNISVLNHVAPPDWPGCIYFDQTGNNGYIISPPISFVGSSSEVLSVRVYPQGGSSASHTAQVLFKSDTEHTWSADKSSSVVNFTARDKWTTVNIPINNPKWNNKGINRLRLYFDSTNRGTRWIIDSISRAPAAPPAAPTAVSATPASIHGGQSSTLTATVSSGEIVEWFADAGGVTPIPGGQSPLVSPTATTTYYARATNTTSGYKSSYVPVTVTVRPYAFRISDLVRSPLPPNPIRVWGKVISTSPFRISDGNTEITLSGVEASVDDYIAVTGDWNGDWLAATEPATTY